MSLLFLETLNGENQGPFRRWLDSRSHTPRIAWYPSAGTDLRDILYLSAAYAGHLPPLSADEPSCPDLFLHTDMGAPGNVKFVTELIAFEDPRTRIRVVEWEELPRCELPMRPELVAFHEGTELSHRVFFFQLAVESRHLGEFTVPLLYVFAENAAFCALRLLPLQARITHLVQVRYGHSLGGANDSPGWLLGQLETLGVKLVVSDGCERSDFREDNATYRCYPSLRHRRADPTRWTCLRRLSRASWDGYHDVKWWQLPNAN